MVLALACLCLQSAQGGEGMLVGCAGKPLLRVCWSPACTKRLETTAGKCEACTGKQMCAATLRLITAPALTIECLQWEQQQQQQDAPTKVLPWPCNSSWQSGPFKQDNTGHVMCEPFSRAAPSTVKICVHIWEKALKQLPAMLFILDRSASSCRAC